MLAPFFEKDKIEAGCDEAGRGCLAGPVCAAAVILPTDFYHPMLNDSKQISEKKRNILRPIIEKEAVAFGVVLLDNHKIDEINILNASILAMQMAMDKMDVVPEQILVDGNRFKPYKNIPFHCMIKGDARFASIAAASVLAKTYRDEFMEKAHEQYPHYGWNTNKGYGTKGHRAAIKEHGVTPLHRMSFRLLPQGEQIELKFKQAK
ncbi:MAG: ribonuclease HII [Chitinophagales bacterium]